MQPFPAMDAEQQQPGPGSKRRPMFLRGGDHQIASLTKRGTALIQSFVDQTCDLDQRIGSTFPISLLADRTDELRYWISAEVEDQGCRDGLTALIDEILEPYRSEVMGEARERFAEGLIRFDDIPVVYAAGMPVVMRSGRDRVGGIIEKVHIVRSLFTYAQIGVRVWGLCNGAPRETVLSHFVMGFSDIRELEEIGLRALDDETRAALEERGRRFAEFVSRPRYLFYDGLLRQPGRGWSPDRAFNASGRVVVDAGSFSRMDIDSYRDCERSAFGTPPGRGLNFFDADDEDENKNELPIPQEDLWRASPYVLGFSMRLKLWGILHIDDLKPIAWRAQAFDKLVLPEEHKHMVRALVEHSEGSFADIVEDKGGGTIFLLHGVPGSGKTTLAEATAEVLQRPLYAVSVGELGVDPGTLESRLRTILDIAMLWNAVILLDEADIFLEARDSDNINRNAMVGVFLRLLEYHNGVLFLTTNRVKRIDEAFLSRVSMAISFEDAEAPAREKVWRNLLEAAGVDAVARGVDVEALSAAAINNRQIKNCIRSGLILAKSQNRPVTHGDIAGVVSLTQDFVKQIRE